MHKDQAIAILIETAKGFYDKNWMLGTSGNLSLRVAPAFMITASGKDKGQLTIHDFVDINAPNASAEAKLHEVLYNTFPEVQAVYHVHTVAATILSMEKELQFSGLEMLKGLGCSTHDTSIKIPVLENTQDIDALSRILIPQINPDVPGFLLKGHGLYAWGNSPLEAKRHIEIFEFLFQVKLLGHL